jgi:dienelactone hydrolase
VTDVDYPVPSGTLRAHLAAPLLPPPRPGIVVMHDIMGLTDGIRAHADQT